MKIKKKILLWGLSVLCLVVIFFVSFLYYGWGFINLEEKVNSFIVERVSPLVGGTLYVKSYRLGLGSIVLYDVKAELYNFKSSLQIEKVVVKYDLIHAMLHSFNFEEGLREIVLNRPQLTLQLAADESQVQSEDLSSVGSPDLGLKVKIVQGSLALVGPLNAVRSSPLKEIKGTVDIDSNGRATIDLEGMTPNGGGAKLDGWIELMGNGYDLQASVDSSDISGTWVEAFTEDIYDQAGQIGFRCRLSRSAEAGGKPFLYGEGQISNLSAMVKPIRQRIDSLNVSWKVEGDSLVIKEAEGLLWNTRLNASGNLKLSGDQETDMEFRFADVDLEKMVALLAPQEEKIICGRGTSLIRVDGPLKDPRVVGKFKAESAYLKKDIEIYDLNIDFRVKEQSIVIDDIKTSLGKSRLWGFGSIALKDDEKGQISIALKSGDFNAEDGISFFGWEDVKGKGSLNFELSGDISNLRWSLRYVPQVLTIGGIDLPAQTNNVDYNGKDIHFESSGKAWKIVGVLSDPFGQTPRLDADLEIDELLTRVKEIGGENVEGEIKLKGALSSIEARGQLNLWTGDRDDGRLYVQGRFYDLFKDTRRIEVKVDAAGLRVYEGKIDLTSQVSEEIDKIQLDIGTKDKKVHFVGSVDRREGESITGELSIGDFPTSDLLGFLGFEDTPLEGQIDGRALISGRIDSLQVMGALEISDARINNADSIKAVVDLDWDNDVLNIHNYFLFQNEKMIFSGRGNWRNAGNFDLRAKSEEMDLSTLLALLGASKVEASGAVKLDANFISREDTSAAKVEFSGEGGHIFGVPFDRMAALLRGDLARLEIHDFKIEKDEKYRVSIAGELPFIRAKEDREKLLNVNVEAAGDLLSFAFRSAFIEEASGNASASFRIGGQWKEPYIEQAEISFSGGQLKPSTFVRQVDDLKGRLVLEPGSNFLIMQGISGRVGSDMIFVKNVQAALAKGQNIPHFVIKSLGDLNLGVLIIETSKDGIEINIPPLMDQGKGKFFFLPRAAGEHFYVGGPKESPLVRGRLEGKNGEFTYPFLEPESESPIFDFVEIVNWDMLAVAKNGVEYFREIPSLVRGVQAGRARARIQEGSYLDFQGIDQDGSFYVTGKVSSVKGTISLLDTEFNLSEETGAEVDTKYGEYARFYGKASTTVYDDSTGVPTQIYLELYALDQYTRTELDKAHWEDFRFKLTSLDPADDSQEKILAQLGYVSGNYDKKAIDAMAMMSDTIFRRHIAHPVERGLRSSLGIDVLRIRPLLASNLFGKEEGIFKGAQNVGTWRFLRGSRLTVGEYLGDRWFLSYTGLLDTGADSLQRDALGIKHSLGLEYLIKARTRLELKYYYDDIVRENDRRLNIRHEFDF